MEFKNILVVLDYSPACTARLELAIRLARQHSARLSGLYAVAHGFFEPKQNEAASHIDQVRSAFSEATSRAGIDARWIGVDESVIGVGVAEIVNQHAYYTDLVVVGQDEPGHVERSLPSGLPERVVLGSGRPVLIVPYADNYSHLGERVMLAWKSGRESTRAANDAMPFLKKAGEVRVVEVNALPPGSTHADSLCAHLALHGVVARSEQVIVEDISIGDALLNRISDEGDDLLVMGAYAHTRLGSLALGDVARHILKHMTVPVLMSH
ncbi:MAG TPA: universal stress protein [Geobacteraceae bacterium]